MLQSMQAMQAFADVGQADAARADRQKKIYMLTPPPMTDRRGERDFDLYRVNMTEKDPHRPPQKPEPSVVSN